MAIRNVAMNAYQNAQFADEIRRKAASKNMFDEARMDKAQKAQKGSFAETMRGSLKQVNDLQAQKADMIEEFASGEKQNVHELMISLQKAGLAMRMTSAVRNKVMEAYKELSRMSF